MPRVPKRCAFGVGAGSGCAFALTQAVVLVGTEKPPKFEIVVTRQTLEPALEVTPQHGDATDQHRMSGQAIDRDSKIVERRGTHEVLPEPRPEPTGPDALLAGALRPQVNEAYGLEIN